jgi:uncharacterized protein RhaS with RHS repeats
MRARYYEPGVGRFVNEDPAEQGVNWFVYTSDNPINLVDPSGLLSVVIIDPGFGVREEGENAAAALKTLSSISQKVKEAADLTNEIMELLVELDPIGDEGILKAIGQLGRDPKKWKKAYMMFTDISGEKLKVHSFAEIVKGVVKAILKGETTPWAQFPAP